jgi:tRNA G18 (ribose-2'-O)-methylase SpoU
MEIVSTMTSDQELLAAAALHDVVEDTAVTEEDIRKEFGDRIASIVAAESDTFVEGVSEEALPYCDGAVELPQEGTKHSLNVSVCAGIVMWEAFKHLRIAQQ